LKNQAFYANARVSVAAATPLKGREGRFEGLRESFEPISEGCEGLGNTFEGFREAFQSFRKAFESVSNGLDGFGKRFGLVRKGESPWQ